MKVLWPLRIYIDNCISISCNGESGLVTYCTEQSCRQEVASQEIGADILCSYRPKLDLKGEYVRLFLCPLATAEEHLQATHRDLFLRIPFFHTDSLITILPLTHSLTRSPLTTWRQSLRTAKRCSRSRAACAACSSCPMRRVSGTLHSLTYSPSYSVSAGMT
jgi:hypothetical protein